MSEAPPLKQHEPKHKLLLSYRCLPCPISPSEPNTATADLCMTHGDDEKHTFLRPLSTPFSVRPCSTDRSLGRVPVLWRGWQRITAPDRVSECFSEGRGAQARAEQDDAGRCRQAAWLHMRGHAGKA